MLLNTKELLALADGDVDADRLAVLLDRLDRCPDSAAALRVLVSLKANREEALEALRIAAESDTTSPIPFTHPSAQPTPSTGWATQGLRMAASIALVGILGVWATTSFFVADAGSAHDLATAEYLNVFARPGAVPTADTTNVVELAGLALDEGHWKDAQTLLVDEPYDDGGMVPLYLGMSQYFLGDYEAAATTLASIQDIASVDDSGVKLQSRWYEANALLALDRPWGALPLVEAITSANIRFSFTDRADETLDDLSTLLGINKTGKQ